MSPPAQLGVPRGSGGRGKDAIHFIQGREGGDIHGRGEWEGSDAIQCIYPLIDNGISI